MFESGNAKLKASPETLQSVWKSSLIIFNIDFSATVQGAVELFESIHQRFSDFPNLLLLGFGKIGLIR